ncbi:hypothetical protein SAMIE_1013920 [Sphingobium amiense]|uniref:Uncharacterized protein n=1 Tax=Sphingobium amiense TaxID=135719 RepID=A0A494W119_9SPHN|nr:hypothetical protein [Sphingobium amiense]BBD97891.1 hypothetical protein SAMIE_1013920 [Sphingobium amiense]
MSLAAILSASRTVAESPGAMRASLHFAGQTLIEYQARQAAQAGADRVLILVGTITPQLSQAVDRLSAEGIAVALVRDMVSMVRDAPRDSDVLLVADGAVIAQAHFNALGSVEGDALLVADDSRASAPFERIDAGQRWAGLARITPALLFGTLDMIGDWDMALTLVRAAVQRGARRVTVPQDDLLEGRVTIVESQQQADLVAQAVTAAGAGGARRRGGAEHYLLAPLARIIGPSLMRMQVPALQVRIGAIALAAIALVPVELGWPTTGFLILLFALLLAECSDRLDELALRGAPAGWIAFCTPGLALLGVVLAGGTPLAMDLALMLGIVGVADRWRRTGRARPWMIFTPATALLLLTVAGAGGVLALGIRAAMLLAIASVAALLLRRNE